MKQATLADLLGQFVDTTDRAGTAAHIAERIGAGVLTFFVWDEEVGAPKPARGFPQTLPASWEPLLTRCSEPDEFGLQLQGEGKPIRAEVFVSEQRTAVVIIGGEPVVKPREIAQANPVLLALFRSEEREAAAVARAHAAAEAQRHTTALASALDLARHQAAASATAARQAAGELEAEVRALQIVNETGVLVASRLELEAIVQAVVDAGVALTGAEFGAFFYNAFTEDRGGLRLYALSGATQEAFARFPHPRATPVFAPTFHGQGIVRSDDITEDPRYGQLEPHHGMPEGHLPVRSYLAVPVISRSSEVIGGLFFGHAECGRFVGRHERVAEVIASQAAVAIDNARLYAAAEDELRKREKVEASLRETDRRLNAVLNNATVAIFLMNEHQHCVYMNSAAERLTGFSLDEVHGRALHDVIHHTRPDGSHYHLHDCPIDRAFPEDNQQQGEEVFVHKDGHFYDVSFTASPIRDEAANAIGTILEVRDITREKQNERTRDLLIREVNHRARNALTLVQSLLQLTKANDIDAYRRVVVGRVAALARAQGSLADRQWRGAPLREVAHNGLEALSGAFDLEGPDIMLPPEHVQPVSMILHELATNASKYGAWSRAAGRVSVTWSRRAQGYEFIWTERGGPSVKEPSRTGFGSRLIGQLSAQLGAQLKVHWVTSGLCVEIRVPAGPNGARPCEPRDLGTALDLAGAPQ